MQGLDERDVACQAKMLLGGLANVTAHIVLLNQVLATCRDRTKEILSDERVQAAQKAGRGGRVRSEEESAAASSVTVVGKSDGRARAAPAQNGSQPAQNGSQPAQVASHLLPGPTIKYHSLI